MNKYNIGNKIKFIVRIFGFNSKTGLLESRVQEENGEIHEIHNEKTCLYIVKNIDGNKRMISDDDIISKIEESPN